MQDNVLLRRHPSMRNELSLFIWPILAIPLLIYALSVWVWGKWLEESFPWWVGLIVAAVMLLFPLYAWFKSLFRTYAVTESTVFARRGLLSKTTSEIRIADIRAINVHQGFFQRIIGIGRVGFSSAAGDAEEVVFIGVRDPEGIKAMVQSRMTQLKNYHTGE